MKNDNAMTAFIAMIGIMVTFAIGIFFINSHKENIVFCAERQFTYAITTGPACVDNSGKVRLVKDF